MTEDEMVGWHYQLNGHDFEQSPGVGDGQGGLECCSPWDRKELDKTQQLNNNRAQKCLNNNKELSEGGSQSQTLKRFPRANQMSYDNLEREMT